MALLDATGRVLRIDDADPRNGLTKQTTLACRRRASFPIAAERCTSMRP
jgi:hypothetical protein